MIIGNGLLASVFKEEYNLNYNVIIFASGVSNSSETDINNFNREEKLLANTIELNKNSCIVYFSSAISYIKNKKAYLEHKQKMESIIKNSGINYLIIRLPQVIGNGGNKNNMINYFVNCIKNSTKFNVFKNTERSLIDVDDIKKIVDFLIINNIKNETIIIEFIEIILVENLIKLIEFKLNKSGNYILVDSNIDNNICGNNSLGSYVLKNCNIDRKNYTQILIEKYVK